MKLVLVVILLVCTVAWCTPGQYEERKGILTIYIIYMYIYNYIYACIIIIITTIFRPKIRF